MICCQSTKVLMICYQEIADKYETKVGDVKN